MPYRTAEDWVAGLCTWAAVLVITKSDAGRSSYEGRCVWERRVHKVTKVPGVGVEAYWR